MNGFGSEGKAAAQGGTSRFGSTVKFAEPPTKAKDRHGRTGGNLIPGTDRFVVSGRLVTGTLHHCPGYKVKIDGEKPGKCDWMPWGGKEHVWCKRHEVPCIYNCINKFHLKNEDGCDSCQRRREQEEAKARKAREKARDKAEKERKLNKEQEKHDRKNEKNLAKAGKKLGHF